MKQAIHILAHKDFAALKKLIAYFKQDCYVFVEVYVGSDNNNSSLKFEIKAKQFYAASQRVL